MATAAFTRCLLCYGPNPSWYEKQPENFLVRMLGIWISAFCSGDHPLVALLCGSRTFKDLAYFMSLEAKKKPHQLEALACHSWEHEDVSRSICSCGPRTKQESRTQMGPSVPPTAVLTSNRKHKASFPLQIFLEQRYQLYHLFSFFLGSLCTV